MPTLYDLKPAFQRQLRPLAKGLAASGVTANQVTLAAAVLSAGTGIALATWPHERELFWLLPLVLFARMELNPIDGMLAGEHDQAYALGVVAVLVATGFSHLLAWLFPVVALFSAVTMVNRLQDRTARLRVYGDAP